MLVIHVEQKLYLQQLSRYLKLFVKLILTLELTLKEKSHVRSNHTFVISRVTFLYKLVINGQPKSATVKQIS